MNRKVIFLILLVSLGLTLAACAGGWYQGRQGVSSSLVDYLYPKGEIPPEHDQQIPNLRLPLRVGLAFVPSPSASIEGLSEAHKAELLEKTKSAFQGREFIQEIVVIPDTYLRSQRGFGSIDQVARLHGLDVMALVSYDQVAHLDDTKASILYWTIVGAYFIPGTKNDVQTFVDTAIFDVATHKLLFRAPGVNKIEGTSTLVNSAEEVRKGREKSFDLAMADMTTNLNQELDAFKERIKEDKSVTISHREGYSGGVGAFDFYTLLILLAAGAFRLLSRSSANGSAQ